MDELGKRVQSLSILFVNLDYDVEVSGPSEELNKIMWRLLEEEFKLTILGLCYKATFDPDFAFTWDDSARASALKIRKIIDHLKFSE